MKMRYNGLLEGKLVLLRSIEESDAEYTFNIRQDKEKTKYLHAVSGTAEDQRRWIIRQIARPDDYTFIIEDKQRKPLGMYGVYNIRNDEAEIGRALLYGNPIQNAEAAILIHDFAFNICSLSKLHANIFEDNKPALALTLHLGGAEVNRNFDAEFKMTNIEFIITKESYLSCRDKVMSLINRFSARS